MKIKLIKTFHLWEFRETTMFQFTLQAPQFSYTILQNIKLYTICLYVNFLVPNPSVGELTVPLPPPPHLPPITTTSCWICWLNYCRSLLKRCTVFTMYVHMWYQIATKWMFLSTVSYVTKYNLNLMISFFPQKCVKNWLLLFLV